MPNFIPKQNQNKQWMPGDATLAMDEELLQALDELAPEVKKDKNTQRSSASVVQKKSGLLKKLSDVSEIPENGSEQQVQSTEVLSPSTPSERRRTRTQAKKENDWRDLAQKLLFSETKKTEVGRAHERESGHTKYCSPQKIFNSMKKTLKGAKNPRQLKFNKDISPDGSLNNSKDYILFSPTHMAAAKERSLLQQQKRALKNLSVSVLTPPPGLDLSVLSDATLPDAGRCFCSHLGCCYHTKLHFLWLKYSDISCPDS